MVLMVSPMVLSIPHDTQDNPHGTHDIPSPTVLKPLRYSRYPPIYHDILHIYHDVPTVLHTYCTPHGPAHTLYRVNHHAVIPRKLLIKSRNQDIFQYLKCILIIIKFPFQRYIVCWGKICRSKIIIGGGGEGALSHLLHLLHLFNDT